MIMGVYLSKCLNKSVALTKADIEKVREIVREETEGLRDVFSTLHETTDALQEDVAEVKIKMDLLRTKEDFFSKMDEVMGELKTIREESKILNQRTVDHEDRIVALEKKTQTIGDQPPN